MRRTSLSTGEARPAAHPAAGLWVVPIDPVDAATEAACLSLLDERERLRHARFLDPRAARGFVLGRGLLRA